MSGSTDPYKILGLQPGASPEEIRQAYRRAATKYHPDAGGDAWAFQQVQQAYDELRKSHEQALHQRHGAASASASAKRSANASAHASAHAADTQKTTTPNSAKQTQAKPGKTSDASMGSSMQSGPTLNAATESASTQGMQSATLRDWLFGKPLRLHNETSYFIFANFMDLVLTLILLRYSAVEANPIANFFYHRYGFAGMVGLKIAMVTMVCLIAQSIASRSEPKAKGLLVGGTLLVAGVVVYSLFLARAILP